MNPYMPPQARNLWNASTATVDQRPSVWNTPISLPSQASGNAVIPSTPERSSRTQYWRPVGSPLSVTAQVTRPSDPAEITKSVKHLECYFWSKGGCKFTAENCLYAHYHTGQGANSPQQVEPGRPAVAGKNALMARPVYENWRGNLDQAPTELGPPRMPMQSTSIRRDIQVQINHIHAREAQTQTSPTHYHHVSHEQTQTSPTHYHHVSHELRDHPDNHFHQGSSMSPPGTSYQPTHYQEHSITASDAEQDPYSDAARKVIQDLSNILEASYLSLSDTNIKLHEQCGALLAVARSISPDRGEGDDPRVSPLLDAITHIMKITDTQKILEGQVNDAKKMAIQDLKSVDLSYLTPVWNGEPSEPDTTG